MRPRAHWTAKTALVAAGFAAAGGALSGVAWAGPASGSPGAATVLGGNGLLAPVSLPVAVCGNAAALLGIGAAGCQGGALASTDVSQGAGGSGTSGTVSLGSGNQLTIPVSVPVDLCGNAAAGLGALPLAVRAGRARRRTPAERRAAIRPAAGPGPCCRARRRLRPRSAARHHCPA